MTIERTELPNLLMLPTQLLLPHEDFDPRRVERLERRIIEEAHLKNPPIIAAIPDSDHYVILDGVNRTIAFLNLKIPHIVAQLVSYDDPGVKIDTWYHVVAGMAAAEFERTIVDVAGMHLRTSSLLEARAAMESHEAIAYIIMNKDVRIVYPSDISELHDLHILNSIVGAYKGKANIFRASNDEWEKQEPFYPGITALVIFSPYEPRDIMTAVKNGVRIPSGVTRHIIPFRALNINIPLDVLNSELSLKQKREWLHEWLMERMAANAIRFYAEPTFTFNE